MRVRGIVEGYKQDMLSALRNETLAVKVKDITIILYEDYQYLFQ